jgi:hypothetical protein
MSVSYERINWEDSPSTATPINAENLNKMDMAISELTDAVNEVEDDATDLKADLSEIKPIVTEEVASTNVFTPISTRIYPDSGTAVINDDKSITITDVPRLSTVWIYAQDSDPITLEAGEYTLCIDNGLYV